MILILQLSVVVVVDDDVVDVDTSNAVAKMIFFKFL